MVLLRFDVGEYSALEASEGIPYDGNGVLQGIKTGDTNARLFQMNVYLGFDIISLTFDNGEETVCDSRGFQSDRRGRSFHGRVAYKLG